MQAAAVAANAALDNTSTRAVLPATAMLVVVVVLLLLITRTRTDHTTT
jgi:hypothetical protein